MIHLNAKKAILAEMRRAEERLSMITKDYSIYYSYLPISHLLMSVGFLRDGMNSLNKDIEKEEKWMLNKNLNQ